MNLPAKHNRIAILMLLSQVLLTGFSFYWLKGQFRAEESILRDNLSMVYKESQGAVFDSMLVEHIISPALGESSFEYFNFSKGNESVVIADTLRIKNIEKELGDEKVGRKAFVTIQMTSSDDSLVVVKDLESRKLDNELLLRSVKLIVQHVDDSSQSNFGSFHGFSSELNGALFISDYESRLIRNGLDLIPVWDTTRGENLWVTGDNIVIGNWGNNLPVAGFFKYRAYLFVQLIPEILLALILILLTGLAFILAYISLRKQMVLNEMRNSFVSNISHELKTPVSTIKVALEAIRKFDLKHDPDRADEYLEMASKEVKRLELLISKVLDNSIIENDRSILLFEKVDLVTLIGEAIDPLKPRTVEGNAKIVFSHPDSLIISGDLLYLQGVIINLIDNSLKYGDGDPEIEITITEEGGYAKIVVSDNGPGIPEQFRKRVFEKFFRIPTSDVHNVKGYGLGLSFAALIVELHSGKIEVHNNRRGCSFIIKIPV
jgi:signal transduction histidine kinase